MDPLRTVLRRTYVVAAGRRRRLIAASLAAAAVCSPALAQSTIAITGDRLSGFVLPVEPLTGDIELTALRARAWTVDDTKCLWLDEDVVVRIAGQEFVANAAVVWLNRLPSEAGLINQIAVFFDRVDNPTRRPGISVAGEGLLVTGSARGEVRLRAVVLDDEETPRPNPLLGRARERLARHLRRLAAPPLPPLAARPQVDRPVPPYAFIPLPGGTLEPEYLALPDTIEVPTREPPLPWLRAPGAVVRFSFGALRITPGELENLLTMSGSGSGSGSDSVVIDYLSGNEADAFSQLTLSAARAVVFTDPGPLEEMARWELDAGRIRGIYLEGNVNVTANDGAYAVRAPRMYYDFRREQAIMADAIFRTYDRQSDLTIYARAREMRQIARDQWEAHDVRVMTSEFYTGHLSLGARHMTVTRRPVDAGQPTGDQETYLEARNITLRAGNMPFFYWPSFAGRIQDVPLRGIGFGQRDNDGFRLETTWDLLTLLGIERPKGVDGRLKIDTFSKRGAALGLELDYDLSGNSGKIDLYGLYDTGIDRTSSGFDVEPDHEFRGVALWEQQTQLTRDWLFQGQASYISDETFITAWRERDFRTRREYESSLYLKQQDDNSALTLLGSFDLNDFISNSYLLASQGYTVDRLPEIGYRTYGNPLGRGLLYSGETSFSRMRFVFEEHTPEELGIRGTGTGLPRNETIASGLSAAGLERRFINRFDTRHEVSGPFDWGIFRVVPFVVGRITAYDDDFESFGGETDQVRVFTALGVRIGTELQRVDNGVESRFFDLHRLRHIVEPSATIWFGNSNISQEDLPVYDLDVESLGTGAMFRVGVRNTLQTQRGGPGQWRSVDFLTVDTNVVFHSSDSDLESPTPQTFDFRPELSQFGDHVRSEMIWLVTDTLALTGEATYDLDESAVARGAVGVELQHSPILTTFVEFRYIDASDSELLGMGWNYRLTPTYRVILTPAWDFREDEFRSADVSVARSFPDFVLTLRVRYDQIVDETTFGASIGLVTF